MNKSIEIEIPRGFSWFAVRFCRFVVTKFIVIEETTAHLFIDCKLVGLKRRVIFGGSTPGADAGSSFGVQILRPFRKVTGIP